METLQLTQAEFDALPEYSESLPTGTTIGKRWKRECRDGWVVGEYTSKEPKDRGDVVRIQWYLPEIVDGPAPQYKPIPVDVGRLIASRFDKTQVVILAYDPTHGMWHTVTYGRSAADKDAAAMLGEAATRLVADVVQRSMFEDYQTTDQAARAEAIERLIEAAGQVRCQCWIAEGGHRAGCWMPALNEAIEAARKNIGADRETTKEEP